MALPPLRPVAGLVPDAQSLLVHIWEGSERVRAKPDDVFSALATIALLYHMKDWAPQMEQRFWSACPFAQTLAEVANGTKHFQITNPRLTASPHVAATTQTPPSAGSLFIAAPLNTQPFNAPPHPGSIRLRTRRFANHNQASYTALEVINEAFEWWRQELAVRSALPTSSVVLSLAADRHSAEFTQRASEAR